MQRNRKIKTYMQRQSRMTLSQQLALNHFWPKYGLELQSGIMDFSATFGRQAPIILEIGFGMGDSLFAMAKSIPDYDFIGVEVHRPGIGALLAKLAKEPIPNIRIYNADAIEVLTHCIPDDTLDGVLIFFPDPWPKRRHHKRRLIQVERVELLANKLRSGGVIHLATDWEDYAIQMVKIISNTVAFKKVESDEKSFPKLVKRPLTKFEKRGQKLGHKIKDLIFVRI